MSESPSAVLEGGSGGTRISGPDTSVMSPAAFVARMCNATYPLISTPASASTALVLIALIMSLCDTLSLVALLPSDFHGDSCEVVRTLACVDAVCPNVLYTFAVVAASSRRPLETPPVALLTATDGS